MTDDFAGQLGAANATNRTALIRFIVEQVLGQVHTGMPVKIVAVHGGGVGPAPTVDVQPLVNMIDGLGKATKHGTVYGISVARNQGGTSAIINDPVVGDIGWIKVGSRDMSAVKATAKQSNPGSRRRFDMSDSVYHGAIINPANPDQWIQFKTTGIVIHDKNGNEVGLLSGKVYVNPNNTSGTIYLGGDGATGSYDFVTTTSGPSINVKARVS
jgi:hypothetical protein